jgi:hypothetical protein
MSKPVSIIIIEQARDIISDQQHWCRGSYARGKAGHSVSVNDPSARRFCAMGALLLAASDLCGTDTTDASNLAHETAKLLSPTGSLVFINDYWGHAAVLSLFDAAIASYAQ